MNKLGIYVHVPFCIQKCRYCDFYSLSTGNDAVYADYAKALTRHFAYVSEKAKNYTVDSIYFGGGTPSLLPEKILCGILEGIRGSFRVAGDCEITLEMNPKTATEEAMNAYVANGFNRLSIGCQSANDDELKMLGRLHCFSDFETTMQMAKRAGFINISADLMMGLPDQTPDSLSYSIEKIAATEPTHISVYGLKIENGTWFALHRDKLHLPDEDMESEEYLFAVDKLRSLGYLQYEISNFCRAGYPSRHNLKYWRAQPYLGFGPAAYSFFEGRRYGYDRTLEGYIKACEKGDFTSVTLDEEFLTPSDMLQEQFLLGLRLTEGIELSAFPLSGQAYDLALRLASQGLCKFENGILSLTPKGMLVDNYITSDLLLCFQE